MTRSKQILSMLLVAAIMIAAMYGVFVLTVGAATADQPDWKGITVYEAGSTTPWTAESIDASLWKNSRFDMEVTVQFATSTNLNVTAAKLRSQGGFTSSGDPTIRVQAASNTATIRFSNVRYNGGSQLFSFDVTYRASNVSLRTRTVGKYLTVFGPEASDPNDPSDPDDEDDDPGLLTPYIIVRNYTYNSIVNPGKDLIVTANLYNESSVTMRNIYIEFAGSDNITPKSVTSSILVDELKPGDYVPIRLPFLTPEKIENLSATITYTCNFQYLNDGKYVDGSSKQVLNIPVKQDDTEDEENEDRFSISMVEVPSELYPGQEGYITITVINRGKKQVSNVSAIIMSDGLANSNYTEYFGAVAPNTKAEIELPILANEAGQFSGTVIVEYEDAEDKLKMLEKEITMNWLDMGGMDPEPWPPEPIPEPEPEPSGGLPWWAWALIGVGVIVVIVLIVKGVKRRKQRQLEVEDEDF